MNKHLGFWDAWGFSSKKLGFLYLEVRESLESQVWYSCLNISVPEGLDSRR